jgi:hypothetical protein
MSTKVARVNVTSTASVPKATGVDMTQIGAILILITAPKVVKASAAPVVVS